MTNVGYARVSTAAQDAGLQTDQLTAAGCDRVYVEVASGARADRPQLAAALDYVRPGDRLVVVRLDRLGRSLSHLVATLDDLRGRDVQFRCIAQPIDTTTPEGRVMYALFGAFAEFERDLIHGRVQDGLAAARAAGKRGGRPLRLTEPQIRYVQRMKADGTPVSELAAGLRVGRATIYRALNLKVDPARRAAVR